MMRGFQLGLSVASVLACGSPPHVGEAEDDLDMDPALAACVQLGLAGPHLAPSPEPVT